jgi:NarL family two-component system response regulator LiaR
MSIKVLVADDHNVVRDGLATFLRLDPEIEVVGTAEDGAEAIKLAKELNPDIVLMDLMMPVMDGLEATKIIRKQIPNTQVLVLTSVLDNTTIARVVQAGAMGYILKNTRAKELCTSIKAAAGRHVQLSPEAAALLVREVPRFTENSQDLTEREKDVLRLLALGHSNKEIAHSLNIAEKTVKTHLSKVFTKLGVQSRTQAVLHASRLGLIPPQNIS